MGDDQDGAGIIAQMTFKPVDRLGVEMVGRLVEQQQFRLLQQQLAERDAAALAARELVTAQSSGGQPSASIACSTWLSRSHRPLASISSCSAVISSAVSSE